MWEDFSHTVGFWADMEHPYVTYDNAYIESEWWALKTFGKRACFTRALKSCPIARDAGRRCPAMKWRKGYKDVKERSAIAKFKVKDEEASSLRGRPRPGRCLPMLHCAYTG